MSKKVPELDIDSFDAPSVLTAWTVLLVASACKFIGIARCSSDAAALQVAGTAVSASR
jgi:hypothetical protein